jgi:undecaprenyl-diphosphatase
MTIFQSIILGIIEGITEFIPVSSTAHLLIASEWLGIASSDFLKTFTISIQVGAILSVAVLYIKTIFKNKEIILKMIAGFIPTALIALSLYYFIRNLFMENMIIIASALILGGIALIILENYFIKRDIVLVTDLKNISYRQAFLIGIFQSLAIIPGVSRSAATIMGGLSLGLSRQTIVEFSFLLAVPVMLAATAFDLYQTPISFSNQQWTVWIIGFVVSFVVAIIGIKFLLKFIKNNNFKIFGWYRIIIGSLVLLKLLFPLF